jgi:hypothetical protein
MGEADRRGGAPTRWLLALLWTFVFVYLMVAFDPSESLLYDMARSWSGMLGLPPGSLLKAGHVIGYVLWAFLWSAIPAGGYRKPLPRKHLWWLLVGVFVVAGTTEALQNLRPGVRHPSWSDVGLNLLGGLLGLLFRQLVSYRSIRSTEAR